MFCVRENVVLDQHDFSEAKVKITYNGGIRSDFYYSFKQ